MSNDDIIDTDAVEIDSFLRCTSIGKELSKHEKRYEDMLEIGVDEKYMAQQRAIVDRLKGLKDEVCENA